MKVARNYTAPYVATSFKEYLANPDLTLCTCWKLVSKLDVTVGATSHTRDLTLSGHAGVTFKSSQGIVPSAADTEMGLGSSGLEVDSIFSVSVLTEESVAAGDWDGAYFEVFLINYEAPTMGELVMFAGTIGEVKTYGERFRAEGRPLTNKSTQQVGMVYTEDCTVRRLGDNRCKLNVNVGQVAFDGGIITTTGTVTTGGSNSQFTDSSRQEVTGYYTYGTVKFTSGILVNREAEIIQHIGSTLGTVLRMQTDSSWKAWPSFVANWFTTAFNDSAWQPPFIEAAHGVAPWNRFVENFPTDTAAQWVWATDSRNTLNYGAITHYFRKTFTPTVNSAVLVVSADSNYEVYCNGVSLGLGSGWETAETYNLSLNAGVLNSIAIRATNNASTGVFQRNPAGVIADITFAPQATASSGGTIKLAVPMTRTIDAGTTYQITRGCDRKWQTCKTVFNNLVNFRGFPFVPGIERAYKVNNQV